VTRLSRRALLTAGLAVATGCGRPEDGPGTGALLASTAPLPRRFATALPVPPVARPVHTEAGVDHYLLTQREADVEVLPGLRTRIWGYDGIFPGPTFRARSGRPMVVTVRNGLPVPTSTHLHGGVTPADSDGFPTDLVVPAGYRAPTGRQRHHGPAHEPGSTHAVSRAYHYPMAQPAATLWYHDHRMDFTGPAVWRGLAGMFVVTDEVDESLPLPHGDRDIPLLICDRSFAADGALQYPSRDPDLVVPGTRDAYMAGVFGDVILVNAAPWPRLEVAAVRYRFRLVNGSNARRYRLALEPGAAGTDDEPGIADRGALVQVGSDAGLLAAPVPHGALTLAPGERYDVVVDFSRYPVGSTVTLVNLLGTGPTRDVLQFVVTGAAPDDSRIPDRLAPPSALARADAVAERDFDFRVRGGVWTVNGDPYDPAGSLASPRLGTVELWRFTSDFHHPVHVHLGHFQVLSRTGRSPDRQDGGWKDTVDVRPYETVEVLVRFTGFRGRYLVHCHNLEHEDMAMMANIDVT
jgi:FtsP/CotA-like multicopper oxidase with cupredoxin domain